MNLFGVDNWLKTPADRDIIARWTVGTDSVSGDTAPMRYVLDLPPPPDPEHWEFLTVGDTGDSDASGPGLSPQDAVAQQMVADAALPDKEGRATLVLHTGDVVYMTGERRLYDRNFRRPYTPFLTAESTVDNLIFRLPFLPVPGNHDYYDLGGWARWLARVPVLGAGLRALAHELFAFSLPEGGSDMGRSYMNAFVDEHADTRQSALAYRPGERTQLPNRYYRFSSGAVDFFALDSNTLDAPPAAGVKEIRADAARHIEALEKRARALDAELRREQRALDRERRELRERAAQDLDRRGTLAEHVAKIASVLARLQAALRAIEPSFDAARQAIDLVARVERRWTEGGADLLAAADDPAAAEEALTDLEEASDEGCVALRAIEACVAVLPEGPVRAQILGARGEVDQALERWVALVAPTPPERAARLRVLSEESLDVQRELSLERRRARYRPEDHDATQINWLRDALAESARERPDAWRVVYLHHPLYTTIGNHCERPDVQAVRDNLLTLLADHVHLILSGHSHAFEWIRSDRLPHVGLFVTGGGGQISLRPSILSPRRFPRHRDRYDALREAGVAEYATGGDGPAADDGQIGPVYHYLRIEVTPDVLRVRPVGVRRLPGGYRREEPMPVYHVPHLPEARPPWNPRRLERVEVRRNQTPRAHWAEK